MFSKHVACVVPVRVTEASYGRANDRQKGKEIVAGTPMVYSKEEAEESDDMYLHAYAAGRHVDEKDDFTFCGVVIESAPPRPSKEDKYEVISVQAGGVAAMQLVLPPNTTAVNYGDPVYLTKTEGYCEAIVLPNAGEAGNFELIGRIHHCNYTNASNEPLTVKAEVRLKSTNPTARNVPSLDEGEVADIIVDAEKLDARNLSDEEINDLDDGELQALVLTETARYHHEYPKRLYTSVEEIAHLEPPVLQSMLRILQHPELYNAQLNWERLRNEIFGPDKIPPKLTVEDENLFAAADRKMADLQAAGAKHGLTTQEASAYTAALNAAVNKLQDTLRELKTKGAESEASAPEAADAAMGVDTVSPLTPEPSPAKRGRSKRKRRGAAMDPMMEDE